MGAFESPAGDAAGAGTGARSAAGTGASEAPRLIFLPGDSNDGFATRDSDKGNPEHVIRELLQNCLDARVEPRPVEVVITIREVPVADLPALDDYREAFEHARSQREEADALSVMEEQIVERIGGVLSAEKMRVLFCRDNGLGLNDDRMSRLLSESNSSKGRGKGGAGSVGLGHLTAFSASDLRYVCYAGQHAEGRSYPETIASGRAVLAAHMHRKHEGKATLRSPNGTLAYAERQRLELFSPGFEMLTEPPPLLDSEIRQMEDSTGAVVAICGFDNFAEETGEKNVDSITKVVVAHFLSALVDERMSVTVNDETTGEIQKINAANVEEKLDLDGGIRAMKGSSFPSKLVSRAYHTLISGERLENVGGAKLLIRLLDAGQFTQVNVFRDGMWITKNAPELGRSVFNGFQPFDAVLLPDNSDAPNDLYDLIRSSEGPDHMEINLKAISPPKRKKLREMLREVVKSLKEAAGEVAEDTYVPEGFAVFLKDQMRDADILPPRTSRRPTQDDSEPRPPPEPKSPEDTPPPSKPRPQKPAPKTGTEARVARSLRPRLDASGRVCGVDVWIAEHNHDHLGIRVFVDPGSDQTCERLLSSRFLKINSGDSPYEVLLDRSSRHMSLDFIEETLPDSVGLSVELVRRKK